MTRRRVTAHYNPRMRNAVRQRSRASTIRALGLAVTGVFLLSGFVFGFGAKEFVMPSAQDASRYPAHDHHPLEKVVVAVDPYDVEDKASIFSVNYRNNGYMPVFFVITNEGDQPISLLGMRAQLNTKDRSKLLPSSLDDLLRRLSHPSRNDGARL